MLLELEAVIAMLVEAARGDQAMATWEPIMLEEIRQLPRQLIEIGGNVPNAPPEPPYERFPDHPRGTS